MSGDGEYKTDPNAWMATLSDLVFLLITFFVLLISMSSMNAKSIKKAFGLFDDAVDVLNFPQEASGSDQIVESILAPVAATLSTEESEIKDGELTSDKRLAVKKFLRALATGISGNVPARATVGTLKTLARKTGGEIKVEKLDEGLSVTLPGRLLFPEGKEEMDEEGNELLSNLSTVLKLWGGEVDVIASWSWNRGPEMLSQVVEAMERNWIKGEKINPKLHPISKRTFRFVLRQENES
ncbi:MAG: hypothetical protein GY847_37990 [Proteobacteria bacterium]|nr:hypothetical protein [Pseudomonadota bacterium]